MLQDIIVAYIVLIKCSTNIRKIKNALDRFMFLKWLKYIQINSQRFFIFFYFIQAVCDFSSRLYITN